MLPLGILEKFREEYEGFKTARVPTSLEAHNLELLLKLEKISFRTKIVKHKKRGREFLIMLVDEHVS